MKAKTVVPLTSGDARRAVQRFGKSPRTAAVPMLPIDAYGTDDWHAARRSMIGASEMAAVLGMSPWASPFSLWWSKQEGWEVEQTLSMRLGHELEPIIARLFAEDRPDLLVCRPNASLWRSPVVEWLGCTPDCLAVAYDVTPRELGHKGSCHIEPVELKSDEGGRGWGRPGTDEVPGHHRVQVLQQCAVFGSPRGHLVRMAGKRFAAYTIEYDDAAQVDVADSIAAGQTFIASLEMGVAPDVDDHTATTDTLAALYPAVSEDEDAVVPDDAASEYERLRNMLAATKDDFKRAQNIVREHLKESRFGVVASTGRRFVDRRVFKRRGFEVPPSMVDALYPVRSNGPKHARGDVSAAEPRAAADGTATAPDPTLDLEGVG